MSQRVSGYVRKDKDQYETPNWVTKALLPHLPRSVQNIWEPACGSGYKVRASDISDGTDFLKQEKAYFDAIVTNPPYGLAQDFIEHALTLADHVAMLLRTDYDHAKSRRHLFQGAFAKKLVLTRRIRWFENTTGSPSFNHAWFIWSHYHIGEPTLAYYYED